MGGRGVPTRAFKIEGCPFYHTGVRPAAAPTRPPTPSVGGRHPLQAQKSPVQSRHRAGGGQPATSRRRRTARQALFSVSAPFSSRAGGAFWKVRAGVGRVLLPRSRPESASIRPSRAPGRPSPARYARERGTPERGARRGRRRPLQKRLSGPG